MFVVSRCWVQALRLSNTSTSQKLTHGNNTTKHPQPRAVAAEELVPREHKACENSWTQQLSLDLASRDPL